MDTNWYILPGMGASSAMYAGLRKALRFEVNFIDWPPYANEASFREVAERVVSENQITAKAIIGGSSLGGMIALEAAMLCNAKAVVLIGSALNANEISNFLTIVSPLSTITPITLIQVLAGKHKQLVSRMFRDADPKFIRSMCRFIPKWEGYTGPADGVYRIHGQKDYIIPCPETNCHIVTAAGHLVAMTHAQECAEYFEHLHARLSGDQT